MTNKYFLRFDRDTGVPPNDDLRIDVQCRQAVAADPIGRAWFECIIGAHTSYGEPVWVPLALDAQIGEIVAATGRLCWVVSPFDFEVPSEGVELTVADPFEVAEDAAAQVVSLTVDRTVRLALMNLVRADDAPSLVRRICTNVMTFLADGGALAVRVREQDMPQTIQALGGRASILLLDDHTAGLLVTRTGATRGPLPSNDNHPIPRESSEFAGAIARGETRANGSSTRLTAYSCFAGGGGLDIGITQAGFEVVGANEIDKRIADVYEANLGRKVDRRSIVDLSARDVPSRALIFGGPPCQSFTQGGNRQGTDDPRGKLIFDYMRLVCECSPLAFLMENVPQLETDHPEEFQKLQVGFEAGGFVTSHRVLLASDYGVPQDRKRLLIIGYRRSLGITFDFDAVERVLPRPTLLDTIGDLMWEAVPFDRSRDGLSGHEFSPDSFGPHFMESNRVRGWLETSNTAVANYRSAPLHPMAYPMLFAQRRGFTFNRRTGTVHRRVTVREMARIQTFPDWYDPCVRGLPTAYKLIGNAVPPKLAQAVAAVIRADLERVMRPCQFGSAA